MPLLPKVTRIYIGIYTFSNSDNPKIRNSPKTPDTLQQPEALKNEANTCLDRQGIPHPTLPFRIFNFEVCSSWRHHKRAEWGDSLQISTASSRTHNLDLICWGILRPSTSSTFALTHGDISRLTHESTFTRFTRLHDTHGFGLQRKNTKRKYTRRILNKHRATNCKRLTAVGREIFDVQVLAGGIARRGCNQVPTFAATHKCRDQTEPMRHQQKVGIAWPQAKPICKLTQRTSPE